MKIEAWTYYWIKVTWNPGTKDQQTFETVGLPWLDEHGEPKFWEIIGTNKNVPDGDVEVVGKIGKFPF